MNRVIIAVFMVAMAMVKTGHTQSVDCNQVFTKLERAICNNPELDELDKELSRLSALALRENTLTTQAIQEMRNGLALRCGGSEKMATCLIAREREAIVQLSLLTGQIVEIKASQRPGELSVTTHAKLKSKLALAATAHQDSGKVTDLISVTLELLDVYRVDDAAHLPAGVRAYEVQALKSRLTAGCNNLSERRHWQRALLVRGQSCSTVFLVDTQN